ncbi:hypothetical protein MGYG_00498 [Nannizzia gypsea CBS 118893]|uniref:Uncharacterized protein n=1 Tax=Arthroderma gypseum (strain ATCC MYA-4604 / CBS 118893) TaxID=535722 RepID=E5R046_ARTGP|nr:hypothetical protein MGYG_00498 [Nannizzia gypsea CBS 118893]EFQ97457.1 hypothetical protein MGYG_00498 [Nannizzia gypsea CBS 118893]
MEPAIFFGLFIIFTIYGFWHPIPLTTINPHFPLPARVAGTIQLTATTNSAVSVFRNVLWPDSNPTAPSNESLHTITPLLKDQLQVFLNKWDHKLEEHISANAERLISRVTDCTPTPTLQAMVTNIIDPELHPIHLDYNNWFGFTFYRFAKKEVRRNPNMYTLAAIFVFVNFWLARSARRFDVREKLEVTKEIPADKMKEIHDELLAHNARLHLVEAKVEGLLIAPTAALTEGQRQVSRRGSERSSQIGDPEKFPGRIQVLPVSQPGRSEFESLQQQLTAMRQDLISLKSDSETHSEHFSENMNVVMSTIKELQKDTRSNSHARILKDAASIRNIVLEELELQFSPLQNRISDIEHYTSSSRENSEKIASQISRIMDAIHELKRESEKAERKLLALASTKTARSKDHEFEFDALQKQVAELRRTTDVLKDELNGNISRQTFSRMNEMKEGSARDICIDLVKKEMAKFESSLRNVEERNGTKSQDLQHLRDSLEALQEASTRSLKEVSDRLDKAVDEIQSKPWTVEREQLTQWGTNVETRLQGLECNALTENNLNPILTQLELLNTKVELVDTLFKRMEDETATKFEHKSLFTDVKDLEGRVNQWESTHQKDPASAMKEEHVVKLRDLGKNCVELRSEIVEIKDHITALISDELPQRHSEIFDKLTESIRLNTTQIEKNFEDRYAHKGDVLRCLNVLQLEGNKLIDLQRLKKNLSEVENYAYGTQNNLNLAVERITDNEQHIESLREGNAINYKDIRRCLEKLGLSGTIMPLSAPINPKPVPGESKPPVHIDLSVGRKINSPSLSSTQDRGDKNISRFDPRYKEDDKSTSSNAEPSVSKGTEKLKEINKGKNIGRHDPNYQDSRDKFRKSYPEPGSSEASKARGKMNPMAESFGERPKSDGDRSLASRASLSQSKFAENEKLEAEATTAKEESSKSEDYSQSPAQTSSHQGQSSEKEKGDIVSISVSDDNGSSTPDLSADVVTNKSTEDPAITRAGDSMEL